MARLTINLSDKLNQEMREYIENNKMTITTFLHLAITKYIESQKQSKEWRDYIEYKINKTFKLYDSEMHSLRHEINIMKGENNNG